MPIGSVKSFSIKAGYGFVKLDNGESCFFKYSDIQKVKELKMLKVGQMVKLVKTVNQQGVKVCEVFLCRILKLFLGTTSSVQINEFYFYKMA